MIASVSKEISWLEAHQNLSQAKFTILSHIGIFRISVAPFFQFLLRVNEICVFLSAWFCFENFRARHRDFNPLFYQWAWELIHHLVIYIITCLFQVHFILSKNEILFQARYFLNLKSLGQNQKFQAYWMHSLLLIEILLLKAILDLSVL